MRRLFQKKQDQETLTADERFVRQSQEWSAAGRAHPSPDQVIDPAQSLPPSPETDYNPNGSLGRAHADMTGSPVAQSQQTPDTFQAPPSTEPSDSAVYESRPDFDSVADRPNKKKGFRFKFPGSGGGDPAPPSFKFMQPAQSRTQSMSKEEIVARIGWLCATGNDDWSRVLELCDDLSRSDMGSREGAKALRKEIKYGTPDTQERAVRLMAIMMWNTSDKFRGQVASKKFLEVVEDVAHSKKTDPKVNAMILKAFGALAYEYQDIADLNAITTLYNKIKPSDAPPNGTPLDESDTTFNPTQQTFRRLPRRQHQMPANAALPARRDIKAEAEVACNNARLLMEALTFTPPAELDTNEIIREFHTKCLQSQTVLIDDIPWATAQAEQSRAALNAQQAASQAAQATQQAPGEGTPPPIPAATRPLSASNPYAALVGPANAQALGQLVQTREEELLAVLLAANTYLVEAFKQYDEAHRAARQETELRRIEEVSRHETRFDRSKAVQRPDGDWEQEGGHLAVPHAPEAGGSRSASPSPHPPRSSSPSRHVNESSEHDSTGSGFLSNNPFAAIVHRPTAQPYNLYDEDDQQHQFHQYAQEPNRLPSPLRSTPPPPSRSPQPPTPVSQQQQQQQQQQIHDHESRWLSSPLRNPVLNPPTTSPFNDHDGGNEPSTPDTHHQKLLLHAEPDQVSDLAAASTFTTSSYRSPHRRPLPNHISTTTTQLPDSVTDTGAEPSSPQEYTSSTPSRFSSRNPYATSTSPAASAVAAMTTPTNSTLLGQNGHDPTTFTTTLSSTPPSSFTTLPPSSSSSPWANPLPHRNRTEDSVIITPSEPSEKAWGKMRRFSSAAQGEDIVQIEARRREEEERLMQRYRS